MLYRKYFEHVLTEHCNLKCENCSMHSPFIDPTFSDLEIFKKDLEEIAKVLRVDDFRFMGGEPTLHPNLVQFAQEVRKSGIAKRIGICTNAVNAATWSDELFAVLDFIEVSVYRETGINYNKINELFVEKQKKFDFVAGQSNIGDDFMVMCADTKLDTATATKNYSKCVNRWSCHSFNNGKYYKCSITLAKNKYLANLGIPAAIDFLETDGVDLHKPKLEDRLVEYVNRTTPMESCYYCHGTTAVVVQRKQMTKEEIKTIRIFPKKD